ncbi:MAG: hypothetical protein COS19_00270 [Flavobacteriaceae bacterium CG02_land_8_20_14_3_00_34_13]|nr:MAG: hypothetical protein COS19_00270 [Flavobacteriaceae bacterium CG02_land_8_20_14_3_00_34_13]
MAVHYFDPNGVDSLRDNGYRDTAMALSELLDNSIQANANKIEIILIEKLSATGKREWLVNEIFVVDNGEGMEKDTLETSLRFGGGTRHGAAKGLGKFGMGLPNSSASQCPRFEVYSWKKNSPIHYNYFDFKEIKSKKSEFLPEVSQTNLPKHIEQIINPKSNSGTIVRWVDCDRLILRRANKLVPHIEWPLGRIFRYYINEKKVQIKIRVFQSSGNSISESFALATPIKAVDPLFLMTNNQLKIPFDNQATNTPWQDGEYLFPDPNGDKENKALYELIQDSIKIKFSIAKSETKRLGGDSELGKIYREFIGISVLRAGREIKLDDFGFIGELGDPLNRWWKVELSFEPNFDSFFGLDNTKQNVHAFRKIIDKDQLERTEDDIQLEFICKLSEFLENQIRLMKKDIVLIDAGSRGGIRSGGVAEGGTTYPDNPSGGDIGPFPSGAVLVPLPDDDLENIEEEKDEDKEELKKWLLLRYPEYDSDATKLNLAIDWFFTTEYNQLIVFLQLGAAEFYNFKPIGHRTIIEINTEHDFYLEFIRPLLDEKDLNKIDPLLLLFGAMVEAEKELVSYQQYISRFRSLFAVKLNQFILDWKEKQ